MRVLETVEIQPEWSDLDNLTYHARPEPVRSPGVHVSDVLRHVAIQGRMYTEEDRADEMPLRILLGLAFEEMAARLYEDMWWQPGEMSWDGIAGSPDGITQIVYEAEEMIGLPDRRGHYAAWCVDEFKYTGKSQRVKGGKADELKDIRTEWMWMQQGMSYVNLLRRAYGKRYARLNKCRFHICWKYGAYVRPMQEVYMRYLVEFLEPELLGNWALLMTSKNEVMK